MDPAGFQLYGHGPDPLVVGATLVVFVVALVVMTRRWARARRVAWGVAAVAGLAFSLWVGRTDEHPATDGWVTITGRAQAGGGWDFEHELTGAETEWLILPVERDVRLRLESDRGLRWFVAPGLGVTRVVGPGAERVLSFRAHAPTEKTCRLDRDCRWGRRGANECDHAIVDLSSIWRGDSAPRQCVEAVAARDYEALGECTLPPPPCPPQTPQAVCDGERAFVANGCVACHSLDGSAAAGPTLLGFFGSVRRLRDGTERVADLDDFTKSIVAPELHLAEGIERSMPAYRLSSREIEAIAAYVRSHSESRGD